MHHLIKPLLTLFVVLSFPGITVAVPADSFTAGNELNSGYVTIVDEQGMMILQTGHEVRQGDEYISEDNTLYEITAVEGTLARCRSLEKAASQLVDNAVTVQAPAAPKPQIAIYHSHTDESYIPNDGTPTQPGNGSILLVGETFGKKLTELGYQVQHAKTLHDPHDANAYQRSRRTAMKLLREQPIALFDVHRDSAPLKVYSTTINGENVSKLLLVVGRQNQNRKTTLDYAKSIKAATDAKYLGLIRGIFIAHGNYNQDLSPRALLVEVGTQYNTREAAERSIALFAAVVPSFLGPGGSGSGVAEASQTGTYTELNGAEPENNTGTTSYAPADTAPGYDTLSIALVIAGGIAAFLFLSTGSWREAKKKLKQFFHYEFVNFLGLRSRRKK